MLDLLDVGTDAVRVRAQIDALQRVRDGMAECGSLTWTGQAGLIAATTRDELVGEVAAVLTTLRGIESRLGGLAMRVHLARTPSIGMVQWVG